jgi:hypothetical protein
MNPQKGQEHGLRGPPEGEFRAAAACAGRQESRPAGPIHAYLLGFRRPGEDVKSHPADGFFSMFSNCTGRILSGAHRIPSKSAMGGKHMKNFPSS